MTPATLRRLALAVVLVALAAALAAGAGFDPRRWAAALAERRAFVDAHPVGAALAYVAAYVAFAALSLPGAWAMSVAGGALFGFGLGFPLALVGSGLGALAAMLAARYLLRDAVRRRFPQYVAKADAGVARDGAFWVVAARLTPVLPFFAVNLAAGLTRIPAPTFAAASLAGSAPLALIYTLAGARLSTDGALWPFAALFALGLAVLAARPLARRALGRKS